MEEKIIFKGKSNAFKKAIVTSVVLGIILLLISALVFSGVLISDDMYLYEHVHGDNHHDGCYDNNHILICEHDDFDTAFDFAVSRLFSHYAANIGRWLSEVILVVGGCVLFCVLMTVIIYNGLKAKEWAITDSEIIIGKKIVPFSSLCGIEFVPSKRIIWIYKKGKNSEKYGLDDMTPLKYNKKDAEEVRKVAEYLLSLFDTEKYTIERKDTGYFVVKEKKERVKPKQFYKKCNTCGHIYCYTQADLNKNKQLSRQAAANTFASAFGPAIMSATYNQTAGDNKSRIIDYDKCPKCNSADVISITEEEVENLSKTQDTKQTNISQADELKKFKELLDNGVITQEEFDAKKKQLLGL